MTSSSCPMPRIVSNQQRTMFGKKWEVDNEMQRVDEKFYDKK